MGEWASVAISSGESMPGRATGIECGAAKWANFDTTGKDVPETAWSDDGD